MSTNADLYEEDFFEWTQTTAASIRAGKWEAIDPESVAEEIESLGKRDRRELGSRLQVLVMHLLKWRYQPAERSGSWRGTIEDQRTEILDLLDDSPSLRRQVPAILAQRYPRARAKAGGETGVAVETFPPTCPWTADQVLAADFWPKG
ncbi:MAG: DUF29 domain-containing protein [Nitrospinae bacterium]|nr:DUF29 domain-containing protein [Nitrospinota bacterium]